MHPRLKPMVLLLMFIVALFSWFMFVPPNPKTVDIPDPSLNYPIHNFTVSSSISTSGEWVMGREIQITCFLQLEDILKNYNWTDFELDLLNDANETFDAISGNIWEKESATSYSIESRPWTPSLKNRFLRINLTLPEENPIQFRLSLWFEQSDFFPFNQNKWIFRFLTDKFVIEPRPLGEQIILGGLEAVGFMISYMERLFWQRVIYSTISLAFTAIVVLSSRFTRSS